MEGLIKFLIFVGITYCIVAWSIGNPDKANAFVNKVDEVCKVTSDVISETLFDKQKE